MNEDPTTTILRNQLSIMACLRSMADKQFLYGHMGSLSRRLEVTEEQLTHIQNSMTVNPFSSLSQISPGCEILIESEDLEFERIKVKVAEPGVENLPVVEEGTKCFAEKTDEDVILQATVQCTCCCGGFLPTELFRCPECNDLFCKDHVHIYRGGKKKGQVYCCTYCISNHETPHGDK